MTRCQAQTNPITVLIDPSANLDQMEAPGVELHPLIGAVPEPATLRIERPVGCRIQQLSKLIRPEAVATESDCRAAAFEILDPVLYLTSVDIPVIQTSGVHGAIGHHEAGIGSIR